MVIWPHVLEQNILLATVCGGGCFSLLGKQEEEIQKGRRTHSQ